MPQAIFMERMITVATNQRNKIHPHKFTLWVAIGSILMMFGGLTSAYIVKRNQPRWQTYELPAEFWWSTAAIVVSSFTIWLAVKALRNRDIKKYQLLMGATSVLGVLFVILQVIGFQSLWKQGFTLQANASFAFIYVIVGLHALHVLGGIIALLVMTIKSFSTRTRNYYTVPAEILATYWHFVDILWVYLLVFLWMVK